jgi:hypothetical protein
VNAPVVTHGQDYPNVHVSWAAPQLNGAASPYVTSYRVVRTDANGVAVAFQTQQFINPLSGTITAPDTSIVDTSAVAGAKYTYTVTAINGTNAGTTSAGTVFNDVISVDSLNTTILANGINLAWSGAPANVPVTAVSITRTPAFSGVGATNPLLLTAGTNGVPLTYLDKSAVPGTSYTYTVSWVANGATQPASSVGPVVMPYPATGQVVITNAAPVGGASVNLAWTDTAPVTYFVIQRCQMATFGNGCGPLALVKVLPGSTAVTFTDSGLAVGRRYKYTITGVNGTVNATTGVIGAGSSTSVVTTKTITVQ